VYLHPEDTGVIEGALAFAYAVYLANVAQYIHRTQTRKNREARETQAPPHLKAAA
jgi:hypothetical protein